MTAQHLYYLFQCFFIYAFFRLVYRSLRLPLLKDIVLSTVDSKWPDLSGIRFRRGCSHSFSDTASFQPAPAISRKCYSCYCNRMADRVHSRKGFP